MHVCTTYIIFNTISLVQFVTYVSNNVYYFTLLYCAHICTHCSLSHTHTYTRTHTHTYTRTHTYDDSVRFRIQNEQKTQFVVPARFQEATPTLTVADDADTDTKTQHTYIPRTGMIICHTPSCVELGECRAEIDLAFNKQDYVYTGHLITFSRKRFSLSLSLSFSLSLSLSLSLLNILYHTCASFILY